MSHLAFRPQPTSDPADTFVRVTWRKSSHSTGDHIECVELAKASSLVGVRDSKHPEAGHLTLGQATFARLTASIKTGSLDL
ncbi:DUF397 domain-containing protein [Actinocorallia sp. A-T 12471]|uniref:DUF397 domain-containing protein n=1 Tax=Actinocorallia sp. A-T 12471 TaxID=3089813 RepID=UPI0029D36123|nr:DUF397 domain-containing protein [Actinocorallia sp. A-T 12471]MDX6741753.1 DUF397 domain-containing protein [Actinocorallia sp. A-T 12471]